MGIADLLSATAAEQENPSGNCHLYFTYAVLFINGRKIFVLFVTVLCSEYVFGH